MAISMSKSSSSISAFFLVLLLFFTYYSAHANGEPICPFLHLYQFGDSISDTGNLILKGGAASAAPSSRWPYGETYFGRPTGRCSNGLLMIDFIAQALRLPLLEPYLKKGAPVDHGVNFSVAGSTALDTPYFTARNVHVPPSNTPLLEQLGWFRDHLASVCATPSDCKKRLRRSLVMMGEIGGNDYNHAFFGGKSMEEVRKYVPDVVAAVVNGVREVVRLGATRIVVPGNFPVGCMPIYLSSFGTPDRRAYDDMGCLRGLNEFALYHNSLLQNALASLRQELKTQFPEAVIVYADYYRAFQSVLRRAPFLGMNRASLLKACCGTGGFYNYDGRRMCGLPGVPVCANPAQYMHWDGIHLTQKAYRHISEVLIPEILSEMQCIW